MKYFTPKNVLALFLVFLLIVLFLFDRNGLFVFISITAAMILSVGILIYLLCCIAVNEWLSWEEFKNSL